MSRSKPALPPSEFLLTTNEVVAKYKVSRRTVYRWVHEGLVSRYYVGSRLRFDVRELDGLIRRGGNR